MALKANLSSFMLGSACAILVSFVCLNAPCVAQQSPNRQSPVATRTSPPAAQQTKRRIATLAVVNRQEITRQRVANECMRRFGNDVMESMVNKFLVVQECQRNGIVITERDVNDEIVSQASKFGMSAENWLRTMGSERNYSVDRLKNDIIWNQLALRRLAANDIQVTPKEISDRMEFEIGAQVQVVQIVVNSLEQATQLRDQVIVAPADFERIAKQFSVDTNSNMLGGLLPPIRRNSGLPEFEKIAFSLKKGDVSQVFPLGEKFIFMRCEKIYDAEELSSEQMAMFHDRIIEEISQEKMGSAAANLFSRLQQTSKVINVMNDPKLRKQMPGVAATVNGTQILKSAVGEECITLYGADMLETEITRSILIQALTRNGLQVEQRDIDAEIARAAESLDQLNPDGTVDINKWLAMVTDNDLSKVEFYIEDVVWPTVAMKKLVSSNVGVTAEDMQKSFEAQYGKRVEVLAIVFDDQRRARRVWQMASANLNEEYFGELAFQYSIEPASKNNYGKVPPIGRHAGQPELEKEVFGLELGKISKVLQVGEFFFILYCRGWTEPVVTDFDVVKDRIHKEILESKLRIAMATEFGRLRDDAQIDNYIKGTSQPGRKAVRSAKTLNQSNSRRRP